jgi:hypothetical protein
MDSNRATLVICLAIIIAIGIPAAIYAMLSRGKEAGIIELFRSAAQRGRDPWQSEDDALRELADRVAKLKERDDK